MRKIYSVLAVVLAFSVNGISFAQAATPWSDLASPTADTTILMGIGRTNLVWGSATGTGNLFNLRDTAGNNAANGSLLDINTATGSSLSPLHVRARNIEAIYVGSNGRVGVGTTSPVSVLSVTGKTPAITLSNTYLSTQAWQIRNGGTSLGSGSFDIYNLTSKTSALVVQNDGNVNIGAASNPYNNSRLYVYGGNNGANVDVRGNPKYLDQAVIELEGSDYDETFNSARLQYYGVANVFGTTMGYPNKNLGVLAFGGSSNPTSIIVTTDQSDLHIGTNNTERMIITKTGNVGVGTTTPRAILDVTSTTSGFLPPRLTTLQRDAIAAPAEGLMIYNLDTHKLNVFTGTWEEIVSR
jgi:hypothetical protein